MGAAASMFCSGFVESAAGIILSEFVPSIRSRLEKLFSSTTSQQEMQAELNVILDSLYLEVIKIKSAIDITRGRRITSEHFLKWLAELINAAYLGEYYYRTFKNRSSHHLMIAGTEDAISRPTIHQRTERTLPFGNDERSKLHAVLKFLKENMSGFVEQLNALPEKPVRVYLYMVPNRLINRCKERVQVMTFLLEPSMAGENNVDILPIVGPSGAGKTTLALDCFRDSNAENQFSLKIYIPCIELSVISICKKILQELNIPGITDIDDNMVITMVEQNLSSQRILLVMDNFDNIDNIDNMVCWGTLLGCLRCAKQGSKVIITSESDVTKKYIGYPGMVAPVMLAGFSEDEYMLFFREHAFGSVDPEDFPELAKMGEIIAKKMNGSIWGAKIIGEILRENLKADFWKIFLQDGILTSKFLENKNIGPVIETISQVLSQVLPKRLRMKAMVISYGNSGLFFSDNLGNFRAAREFLEKNQVKNFRHLMARGPEDFTPVIKEGENDWLVFSVAKHRELDDSIVFYALCQLIGDESVILLESP